MNYRLLESIRKDKNISQVELSKKIGLSESTYKKNIAKKNITVEALEKIAELLNVKVSIFFEEENNGNINDIQAAYNVKQSANNQLLEIMQELKNQLRVKDDQIAFLQHLIDDMHK